MSTGLAIAGLCVTGGLIIIVLVKLGELGEQPPLCQTPSPPVGALTYYCSQLAGHSGLHRSADGVLYWDDSEELGQRQRRGRI